MSRIFNPFVEMVDGETFAIHETFITDHMGEMQPTCVVYYLYLLNKYREQKYNPVDVFAGDLMNDTGMSRNTLKECRCEFRDRRLVNSYEVAGSKRGHWQHEFLNLRTGKPMMQERSQERIEFGKLSDWVVTQFYERQLKNSSEQNGKYFCPLKSYGKPSFTITYAKGDSDRNGMFACSKCQISGGMIAFYMRRHNTDKGRAYFKVQAILHDLITEDRERIEALPPANTKAATMEENPLLSAL